MLTRRALLGAAGVALADLLAAACTAPAPSPSASPVTVAPSPARPIATVAVYSALDDGATDALVAAFRAVHPDIAVDVLSRASIVELWTRIRVERGRPKAAVLLGGESAFHAALAGEGLLEPARDWYLALLGFVGSQARSAEVGGAPAGWDDLLADRWKGKLTLPDPSKTAAGYVFLAAQVFRFSRDEDAAMDYMHALHANVERYAGRTGQAIELVAAGTEVGAPAWAADSALARSRGAAVDLSLPAATATGLGALSLVRGVTSTAAGVFADWLLSREGGEALVRAAKVVSVRTDVAPPSGVPALDTARLVPYDRAWAAAERQRLVDKWLAVVGR